MFGDAVRDLSYPLVEVRHARLDTDRHTRLVHLHHIIVRQLVARLEQSNCVEAIPVDRVQIVSHQCAKGAKVTAIAPTAVLSVKLEKPPVDRSPRGARSEHAVAAKEFISAFAYQYDLNAALSAFSVKQAR